MRTMTQKQPVSDLMYDWLTILQSKAEGLNAYERYIQDAERENAEECLQLLHKLQEHDARLVEEVRDHLANMMARQYAIGK